MNEEEWLTSRDPKSMLAYLGYLVGERKLRLFAATCCRQVWHNLVDVRSKAAVEAAERYADGLLSQEDVAEACAAAEELTPAEMRIPELRRLGQAERAELCAAWAAGSVARTQDGWEFRVHVDDVLDNTLQAVEDQSFGASKEVVTAALACLFRDIFSNPFRPLPPLDPAWLQQHDVLVRLAQAAYNNRVMPAGTLDPDRVAVLADALEDASAGGDLIAHLRGPGPHVRGCHVIDLLLNKE
jgi:hypothetical protein